MGCDIHMFGEVFNGSVWEPILWRDDAGIASFYREEDDLQALYDGRWYAFFGALSDGVRGYRGEPARGIPSDCSHFIKRRYEGWGEDAHSASWLSLEELYSLRKEYEDVHSDISYGFDEIISRVERLTDGERVRVVFWFDS